MELKYFPVSRGAGSTCSSAAVYLMYCSLQVGKSYAGPREALRLAGKFVLNHLLEAAKSGPDLASSPFVLSLHQEVRISCHAGE